MNRFALALALVALPLAAAPALSPAGTSTLGTWKIASATNPGGKGGYTGTVTMTAKANQVGVSWAIPGGAPYTGVGVVVDNVLGIGWGTGTAYGVAVYKVAGGKLTGTWGTMTSPESGSETLEGPAGLNGEYKITAASTPGGKGSYAGTVSIVPSGKVYNVTWKLAKETYTGVGILRGDVLVVGWGIGGNAGVVAYDITPGKLNGFWAVPGGTDVGTEVLSK